MKINSSLRKTIFITTIAAATVISAIVSCGKTSYPYIDTTIPVSSKFANPLMNGADPSVFQKDGTYYYMQTTGNNITLWSTKKMSTLASASPKTIYTPSAGTPNSRNVWAPEMYFIDGKWYIYYTAGNGNDESQRTWVLENSSADPMTGTWVEKGRLFSAGADFWAIDGTVMEYNGSRYFLWCGRPDLTNNNLTQNIYISKMTNPYTLEATATMISAPEYNWEKNGFAVNEGPEILVNGDKTFLVYSASFCGTDDYGLGMLSLKSGGNPLVKSDWTKTDQPIFTKNTQNNAFGPGHNSFFKSPDGKENWIIYHANSGTNQGCADRRNIRMQKFTFKADGSPDLGTPVAVGLQITKPSGEM